MVFMGEGRGDELGSFMTTQWLQTDDSLTVPSSSAHFSPTHSNIKPAYNS